MNAIQLIDRIDWPMLKEQKRTLISIIEDKRDTFTIEARDQLGDLEGLLELIESIQDCAVDEMGVPEELVFDLENEEQ
jgi:hypothetical protein